jgi:hypothetical protein
MPCPSDRDTAKIPQYQLKFGLVVGGFVRTIR